MSDRIKTQVSFDPDILRKTDRYVLDQKEAGNRDLDRSTVINAALAEFLERHEREEEA